MAGVIGSPGFRKGECKFGGVYFLTTHNVKVTYLCLKLVSQALLSWQNCYTEGYDYAVLSTAG